MLRTASSSSSGVGSCGCSDNWLLRTDLFGVDLLQCRALLVARDLPLRRIRRGHRQERRRADLLGNRLHPLDQLLDPLALVDELTGLEIDEVTTEAPADRPPEVLLDQPVRGKRQRLTLVQRTRRPRGERVRERGEGAALAQVRLGVADANLDRRKREMGAD